MTTDSTTKRPSPIGKSHFNNAGMRMTLQRNRILEVIETSGARYFSVDDIFRALVDQGVRMALSTIYRALSGLQDSGLLARHVYRGKVMFLLNEGVPSDRLVCIGCGRVDHFQNSAMDSLKRDVAAAQGYELSEKRLALYGYCSACAAIRRRMGSPWTVRSDPGAVSHDSKDSKAGRLKSERMR